MLDSTGILVSAVAFAVLAWGVLIPTPALDAYPLAAATAAALLVFAAGAVAGRYR
ncbi:hypothetical protein [Salarchaeum sp. JOR-1]|uniref:hypothetical protein n=1 Tax=Salarchaeum sp. JOR-1 TaxID=2599399 RepID=UPI00143D71C4|nr:hypothetical protein [Salarchaeum sp. JOR-1]